MSESDTIKQPKRDLEAWKAESHRLRIIATDARSALEDARARIEQLQQELDHCRDQKR